jgi:hypothetical protein
MTATSLKLQIWLITANLEMCSSYILQLEYDVIPCTYQERITALAEYREEYLVLTTKRKLLYATYPELLI